MPKAYPLDWPEGSPRSRAQEDSRFKTSFSRALETVRKELRMVGASHVLISCNLPTARDGWPDPRASLKNRDPGVAVYWILVGKTYVIACDHWTRVEDNLHAVALTIGADRAKVRWGCSAIEARSMAGYLALPSPPKEEPWWTILGVSPNERIDVIEAVYRTRMKSAHPDTAKNEEDQIRRQAAAARYNLAVEAARKAKENVA